MGYSQADNAVIDTGGTTVWRVSSNGIPAVSVQAGRSE